MATNPEILKKLTDFKQQDKFANSIWENRGLNPSSPELCERLSHLFDNCTDKLIIATNQNASTKEFRTILKNELKRFNKLEYDTEEKELICEYFYKLSNIINVDFGENLNRWLYGSVLTTLMKLARKSNPDKIVDTIKQPCTNCGVILETYITKYQEGIQECDFFIVKCNSCYEYNLLSLGKNIGGLRLGNYTLEEKLWRVETTEEQAKARLEQIKYFRQK